MGGKRIEDYWSAEMRSVLDSYHQFEILIPAAQGGGSAHPGEDGRYVESILKDMLRKFLPAGLEVLTGFILRAGVKGSFSGTARKKDKDYHSSQLDIIIYDSQNYPVYQRFGDTAVVLPEGVIGVISVKKTLRTDDLEHEIKMLQNAAKLCAFRDRRGPFLGLVCMNDGLSTSPVKAFDKAVSAVEQATMREKTEYSKKRKDQKTPGDPICYDDMPCFIGNLQRWTIHKTHREQKECAEFQLFIHREGEEHLGIQYLLKGILDIYYCEERHHGKQPGYVSFPTGRGYDKAEELKYEKKRSCRLRNSTT